MNPVLVLDVSWLVERYLCVLLNRMSPEDPAVPEVVADMIVRWTFSYASQHKTKYIVAAFDGGSNFRYEVYPYYKLSRVKVYDQQNRQLALDEKMRLVDMHGRNYLSSSNHLSHACRKKFREYCMTLGIACVHLKKYEADDVIASLAAWGDKTRNSVLMCTPDKDMVQSVSKYAHQWVPEVGTRPEILVNTKTLGARICKLVNKSGENWDGDTYLAWQTLYGDAGDDVPRLVSKAKAATLLNTLGSDKVVARCVSDGMFTYEQWERNSALITLKRDLIPEDTPKDAFLAKPTLNKLPSLHVKTRDTLTEWTGVTRGSAKLHIFHRD